jgi:hypothetical protein
LIQDTDNQQIVSDFILGYLGKTVRFFTRTLFLFPFVRSFFLSLIFLIVLLPFLISFRFFFFICLLYALRRQIFFSNVILTIFPSPLLDFFVYMFPLFLFPSSGNTEMRRVTNFGVVSLEVLAVTEFNEIFLGRQPRQDVKIFDVSRSYSVRIYRMC